MMWTGYKIRLDFWRSAFQAAWNCAHKKKKEKAELQRFYGDCVRELGQTLRRLKSVEESYCDSALQLLALDREHQLLKLRSPTQLNAEYEAQVLAVSMERPDVSPTKQFEAKAGRELNSARPRAKCSRPFDRTTQAAGKAAGQQYNAKHTRK